jgi:hypothetical protein
MSTIIRAGWRAWLRGEQFDRIRAYLSNAMSQFPEAPRVESTSSMRHRFNL